MSHIKIVNRDGVSNSTEVMHDGKRISGVTKIIINPITSNEPVTATISFELVTLDLNLGDFETVVDDVFINDKIKTAIVGGVKGALVDE